MAQIDDLPVIWLRSEDLRIPLQEIMTFPGGTGSGISSELPRAVIAAGISENELYQLMAVCRKTGMKSALWATLTPVNEKWCLGDLLEELQKERELMKKAEGE